MMKIVAIAGELTKDPKQQAKLAAEWPPKVVVVAKSYFQRSRERTATLVHFDVMGDEIG